MLQQMRVLVRPPKRIRVNEEAIVGAATRDRRQCARSPGLAAEPFWPAGFQVLEQDYSPFLLVRMDQIEFAPAGEVKKAKVRFGLAPDILRQVERQPPPVLARLIRVNASVAVQLLAD